MSWLGVADGVADGIDAMGVVDEIDAMGVRRALLAQHSWLS